MTELHHVREAIETLLAACAGEATLAEGLTLHIGRRLDMTLSRSEAEPTRAVLAFDPPPSLHFRRGPLHLRCSLTSLTIGPDEVLASIDGWFDRHWKVVS